MNLRSLALAPVLAVAIAFPAAAEKIALRDISAYLNSFRTATADFTQISPNGVRAKGKLYMQRPGRVRFEYGGKSPQLVLASGGQVAVFDPKSNQGPQEYPLAKTPLSIILADRVDLGRSGMVTGYGEFKDMTVVQAQDPQHPEYGNIQLFFSANPVALRQWVVTDDAGKKTTVQLGPMQTGVQFKPSVFSIENAKRR